MIDQIVILLGLDSNVTDLVSDRIYPDHISQDAPLPAISMGLVSKPEEASQDGSTDAYESTLQIDCWASTHQQAIAIKTAVLNCLTDYSGVSGSVQIDHIMPSDENHFCEEPEQGSEDWTYHIAIDFQIWHQNI